MSVPSASLASVNAHPSRLDLSDVHCRMARDQGVLISINSDSHSRKMLGYQAYGLFTARRGWLEAKDVINTFPIEKLRKVLKKEEYPAGASLPEAGEDRTE